jgi:hypothetical protein
MQEVVFCLQYEIDLVIIFWPFMRIPDENVAQNAPKVAFLATISLLYMFSTMPDRMAWSYLKSEVVFVPLLRMRIVNVSRSAHNIELQPQFIFISRLYIVLTASSCTAECISS